ncbi:MAG: molybdopterin molybdotransferase MoeA [Pseudomonadota bacterium]
MHRTFSTRPPEMPNTLITPDEVTRIIAAAMPQGRVAQVPLERAYGRRLAETVAADRDQPPFDRVTMDGIALRSEAVAAGQVSFPVGGVHGAGQPQPELTAPDHCLEVMTGSVMPRGCDSVVPVEDITLKDGVATLGSPEDISPWRFVHRRGTDYPIGQVLLQPGTLIRGPELAVLASVGRGEVSVRRWPSALVVATGDELVEPGNPVAAHQIRMANDYAIAGRLTGMGLTEVSRVHLRDDPELIAAELARGLEDFDLIILTGGVSRGRFDHVPGVLENLGVKKQFHRVNQKPGKPMWFGVGPTGQPVFALPGNPVSALVCFHRYVEPALRAMSDEVMPPRRVELASSLSFSNDMTRFVPVNLLPGSAQAKPLELNTSGDFFALAGSSGFCELPSEQRVFKAGVELAFFPW